MELGGNIEMIGFNDLDSSEIIILKKIIGNYARKFLDYLKEDYQKLTLNLKHVHGKSKYEVNAKLMIKGKPVTSEVTGNNLFMTIADSLKKIESQVIKN